MGRTRDVSKILNSNTPLNSTYLTLSSASSTYQGSPNRNIIINGAMNVDQRNSGALISNASNGTFSVDRWAYYQTGVQQGGISAGLRQNLDSLTPPSNFKNYLGISINGNYSPSASEGFYFSQAIEANNISNLNYGTASSLTTTLSFWIRINVAGTFSGTLSNYANTRAYPFTFTVNSANTWEYKTITIPGDTSGTWVTSGTAGGMRLNISLGVGSSLSGTAGSWATFGSGAYGATGAIKLSEYWTGSFTPKLYITGVQLEIGSSATPFEFKTYAEELIQCQRYYENGSYGNNSYPAAYNPNAYNGGAGFAGINIPFKVTKRTTPHTTSNLSISGMWTAPGSFGVTANTTHTFTSYDATTEGFKYISNRVSGNATPTTASMYFWEGTSITWNVSAEL